MLVKNVEITVVSTKRFKSRLTGYANNIYARTISSYVLLFVNQRKLIECDINDELLTSKSLQYTIGIQYIKRNLYIFFIHMYIPNVKYCKTMAQVLWLTVINRMQFMHIHILKYAGY